MESDGDLSQFASFTDETSARVLDGSALKVSITGEVACDDPLDWFFDLVAESRRRAAEPDSTAVLDIFRDFPRERRERIRDGMKRVRIHVTDPRVYAEELADAYLTFWRTPFPSVAELRAGTKAGDPLAFNLLRLRDEAIAEQIVLDSPPIRIASKVVLADAFYGLIARKHDFRRPLGLDAEALRRRFRSRQKSVANRLAEWASKSGSVFAAAEDRIAAIGWDEIMGSTRFSGAWSAEMIAEAALEALVLGRAYDEGDRKGVEAIASDRDAVVAVLTDLVEPFSSEPFTTEEWCRRLVVGPIETLPSAGSARLQAADIAAAFARSMYEKAGPIGVVREFDYMTFNGERIGERDAEQIMRRWRIFGP